jgi:hypothetical protein
MVARLRAESAAMLTPPGHPAVEDLERLPLLFEGMVETVERVQRLATLDGPGGPLRREELQRELEELLSGHLRLHGVALRMEGSPVADFGASGDVVRELVLVLSADLVESLPRQSTLTLRLRSASAEGPGMVEGTVTGPDGIALEVEVDPGTRGLAEQASREAGLEMIWSSPAGRAAFRIVAPDLLPADPG